MHLTFYTLTFLFCNYGIRLCATEYLSLVSAWASLLQVPPPCLDRRCQRPLGRDSRIPNRCRNHMNILGADESVNMSGCRRQRWWPTSKICRTNLTVEANTSWTERGVVLGTISWFIKVRIQRTKIKSNCDLSGTFYFKVSCSENTQIIKRNFFCKRWL